MAQPLIKHPTKSITYSFFKRKAVWDIQRNSTFPNCFPLQNWHFANFKKTNVDVSESLKPSVIFKIVVITRARGQSHERHTHTHIYIYKKRDRGEENEKWGKKGGISEWVWVSVRMRVKMDEWFNAMDEGGGVGWGDETGRGKGKVSLSQVIINLRVFRIFYRPRQIILDLKIYITVLLYLRPFDCL